MSATFDRALDALWLAFQPIVRWSDKSVLAYEALVRNNEPALARPDVLFAAAEELNRVSELGRRIRALAAAALPSLSEGADVFVNLHAIELLDPDLFDEEAPLTKVAPRIVLEITERWSLDTFDDARERIHRLRQLGFRVAIDDLGAGYAGLTSFAHLKPEIVKLDMSLVRGVDGDPTRQHLVRSINALCSRLGITVVAEGIETPDERDTLVSLGSDLLQGYLFSKPAPPFPKVDWDACSVTSLLGTLPKAARSPNSLHPAAEVHDLLRLRETLTELLGAVGRAPAEPHREWHEFIAEIALIGQQTLQAVETVLRRSAVEAEPLSIRAPRISIRPL